MFTGVVTVCETVETCEIVAQETCQDAVTEPPPEPQTTETCVVVMQEECQDVSGKENLPLHLIQFYHLTCRGELPRG